MRSCDEIVEWISASLDGELTADEQAALNEHIACCPACSALLDDLRALHAAAAQEEEVSAPAGFTEAVMAAIAAESAPKKADNVIPFVSKKAKRSLWKQWGVTAAAIAIVLLGAVSFPSLMGNFTAKSEADMDMPQARENSFADAVMDMAAEAEYSYGAADGSQNKPQAPAEAEKPVGSASQNEPGAPAPSSAPEEAFCVVGELVLEGMLDVLKEYEGAACSDGTVTYLVPADVFADVLELLEAEKPVGYSYTAGVPDAELGKITVQSN